MATMQVTTVNRLTQTDVDAVGEAIKLLLQSWFKA